MQTGWVLPSPHRNNPGVSGEGTEEGDNCELGHVLYQLSLDLGPFPEQVNQPCPTAPPGLL